MPQFPSKTDEWVFKILLAILTIATSASFTVLWSMNEKLNTLSVTVAAIVQKIGGVIH